MGWDGAVVVWDLFVDGVVRHPLRSLYEGGGSPLSWTKGARAQRAGYARGGVGLSICHSERSEESKTLRTGRFFNPLRSSQNDMRDPTE